MFNKLKKLAVKNPGMSTSLGIAALIGVAKAMGVTMSDVKDVAIGITYRSKIDLNEEGQANLYLSGIGRQYDASVSVPIPAALNIGISKTWNDRLTLEFVYERTFWSAYETLDFEYGAPIQPVLVEAFDDSKDKLWEDTNTFRLGLTYQYNDKLTLMAGYSYDETPILEEHVSYELPDSDAKIFSMGFRYQQTENLSWGLAMLYDAKDSLYYYLKGEKISANKESK
jgi:long-chain fatty acid transport protein